MSNFSLEWPCSFGYKDFRFRRLFPVNGHYRDHFPTLFFRVFQGRLPQIGRCNFSAFSYGIRDGPINISGFVGNFRLPVVVDEMPYDTCFYLCVAQNLGLPLEFQLYLSYFWRYKYFRFVRPYCYFRLSIVVEITISELAMTVVCSFYSFLAFSSIVFS